MSYGQDVLMSIKFGISSVLRDVRRSKELAQELHDYIRNEVALVVDAALADPGDAGDYQIEFVEDMVEELYKDSDLVIGHHRKAIGYLEDMRLLLGDMVDEADSLQAIDQHYRYDDLVKYFNEAFYNVDELRWVIEKLEAAAGEIYNTVFEFGYFTDELGEAMNYIFEVTDDNRGRSLMGRRNAMLDSLLYYQELLDSL